MRPEPFTGKIGVCTNPETLKSFDDICDGRADDRPEQAFLCAGGLDEPRANAKEMK